MHGSTRNQAIVNGGPRMFQNLQNEKKFNGVDGDKFVYAFEGFDEVPSYSSLLKRK